MKNLHKVALYFNFLNLMEYLTNSPGASLVLNQCSHEVVFRPVQPLFQNIRRHSGKFKFKFFIIILKIIFDFSFISWKFFTT